MKTKTNIKAGYSDKLLVQPLFTPDLQLDSSESSQGKLIMKTGQAVAAILE